MNPNAGSQAPDPDHGQGQALQTRWSLIERLKDWGDEASWQDFFSTYRGLIYGVALKAGLTDTEAQEVVQETVISVAKKMPEFKCGSDKGSFKSFLLQITSRRIADQFRKRPRSGQASHESAPGEAPPLHSGAPPDESRTATIERVPDPAGSDLERVWNKEWKKHLIENALARVKALADPEQFQMFELHVLREVPVREVARTLGVNAAQIYFAKYKVTRLLKKETARLEQSSFEGQ